jgi:molybdopterin/thiamine biosynthesis adenylyltransferase/N-acetylglutamate synthase-like GNAT family acetyltransferase
MSAVSPPLSPDELARYARHIVLPEVGGAGQQKLKRARVLVVGAGGLGAPVLAYLAAAGVGTLGILDDDTVSLSNLQRQVIHTTAAVGEAKTVSAARAVQAVNPHVVVELHPVRLGAANSEALVGAYDLVVDGSDNFETRYLVADACAATRKPLVHAAIGRFDGSLTVLMPYAEGPNGQLLPSYRDLFPEPPPEGLVPSCAQAGVIGALAGVIGTLQAMEAIKLITGIGEPLVGRLLLYDALAARFDTITYKRRKPAFQVAQLPATFGAWGDLLALIRRAYAPMDGVIDPPSSTLDVTPQDLQQKAARETVFVAEQGGRLIGCVFLHDQGDHLYLGRLAVDPALHGQGVGGALITKAIDHAKALGREAIELQARVELTKNHAIFSRFGFKETERTSHPGYDRPTSITFRKQL